MIFYDGSRDAGDRFHRTLSTPTIYGRRFLTSSEVDLGIDLYNGVYFGSVLDSDGWRNLYDPEISEYLDGLDLRMSFLQAYVLYSNNKELYNTLLSNGRLFTTESLEAITWALSDELDEIRKQVAVYDPNVVLAELPRSESGFGVAMLQATSSDGKSWSGNVLFDYEARPFTDELEERDIDPNNLDYQVCLAAVSKNIPNIDIDRIEVIDWLENKSLADLQAIGVVNAQACSILNGALASSIEEYLEHSRSVFKSDLATKELLAEYQAVLVDLCRDLGVEPRVDIPDPTYYQEVIDNALEELYEPSLKNAVVLKQQGDDALLFTGNNVEPFVVALGYDPENKDWSAGTYYSDLRQATCDFDKQFGALAYNYSLELDDLYPILEEKGFEPTHENARALMLNTNDFEGVSRYINENLMMLLDDEIASVGDVLVRSQAKTMPQKSFHARSTEEIIAQQSPKAYDLNPKDDIAQGRNAAMQSEGVNAMKNRTR